ncbi:carboxymuconolactone decarboxylase family protein [Streptomyces sp. NPDC091268]|uniref:carboxymuconolactone decarboxylase family protein n=1 Tax=Streptomyces sp. NPDC091268 TaxID=3365979 RepID=UPI00380A3C24
MQTRLVGPAIIAPGATKALAALAASAAIAGVSPATQCLVHLRASQLIGCAACTRLHGRALKRKGETNERLGSVADWRGTGRDCFTDAERAALSLTEAVTRAADDETADGRVPDEVWAEASRHYGERALAALFATVTTSDAWHRFHPATATAPEPPAPRQPDESAAEPPQDQPAPENPAPDPDTAARPRAARWTASRPPRPAAPATAAPWTLPRPGPARRAVPRLGW